MGKTFCAIDKCAARTNRACDYGCETLAMPICERSQAFSLKFSEWLFCVKIYPLGFYVKICSHGFRIKILSRAFAR